MNDIKNNPLYGEGYRTKNIVKGTYKNHDFYIQSLASHPTAYVVTNNYLYDVYTVDVHGGITFNQSSLRLDESTNHYNFVESQQIIGWDYMHYNDYSHYPNSVFKLDRGGHIYTVEEVFKDVVSVIDQLERLGC